MVKRIAIGVIALSVLFTARAAQTILNLETLIPASPSNLIPLSSTNFNTFWSVTGILPVVGIGATTNTQPDQGWSVLAKKATSTVGIWTNMPVYFVAGAWFYFNQFAVTTANAAAASQAYILQGDTSANKGFIRVGVDATGGILLHTYPSNNTTNYTVPSRLKWYWIGYAYHGYVSAGIKADVKVYIMPVDGALTEVDSHTGDAFGAYITACEFGTTASSSYGWSGRMSGMTACSIADFADVAVPTIAPTTNRVTWFVNPSTGDDAASGLYGYPWKSVYQLTTQLQYGGVMGDWTPWKYAVDGSAVSGAISDSDFIGGVTNSTIVPGGNKVMIDTSAGTALAITNTILFDTWNQGIEICGTNGQATISPYETLTVFTQYDAVNYSNIWQAPVVNATARSVMWEDKRWMHAPWGANIAAVRAYLQATNGSFYCDASNLYFSPFEVGSDPNTSGHVFECSRRIYAATTGSSVLGYNTPIWTQGGSNIFLHDLKVYGNPFIAGTTGAYDGTYAMGSATSGKSVFMNLHLLYGGNHDYGATGMDDTGARWFLNSICEQCAPWTSTAYSAIVEFTTTTTPGTRRAYYYNVDFSTNAVIGSTTGVVDGRGIWYCHATPGDVDAYSRILIDHCKGAVHIGNQITVAGGFEVSNGHHTDIGASAQTNLIINACVVTGPISAVYGAYVTNCLIQRLDTIYSVFRNGLTNIWVGNTMDARVNGGNQLNSSLLHTDAATATVWTFKDNIFLMPQDANNTVWLHYKNADTIISDNNVFMVAPAGKVAKSEEDGDKTWAQWQGLAHDAASVTNNPCLDTKWRPYAKTPCWNTGVEIGPLTDLTGKLFQSRRTCGAYEYKSDAMLLISR